MKSTVYRALVSATLLARAACGGGDSCALGDVAASDGSDPSSGVAPGATPSVTLPVSEQVARIEERLAATHSRDWDSWQALHTPDAVRTAPEREQPLEGSAAMSSTISFSRWCNSDWSRRELCLTRPGAV